MLRLRLLVTARRLYRDAFTDLLQARKSGSRLFIEFRISFDSDMPDQSGPPPTSSLREIYFDELSVAQCTALQRVCVHSPLQSTLNSD